EGKLRVLEWANDGRHVRWLQSAGAPVVITGLEAWGQRGVCVSLMGTLPVTIYEGTAFDDNVGVLIPKQGHNLAALWAFCEAPNFRQFIRSIDTSIKVAYPTLLQVPFDLAHWQKVAAEKYPNGLPEPESDDPTQWLFHGRPEAS